MGPDGMQLDGKRVIVTGAARGIGGSAARAFAAEGAAVCSFDVLDEPAEQLAREAAERGPGSVRFYHCDITRRDDVQETVSAAVQTMGGLDALVNAAGIERRAPAEHITDADWDLVVGVNLRGTFLTNQAVFPYLRDNGGGRIVNFASGAALYPYLEGAHYSAAKGGVISWTRTIAHEWGKHNITALAIDPAIWTPMYEEHRSRLTAEQLATHDAVMATRIPLGGRLGDPDGDIAPVLVFLMSEGSRFMTGQIIAVDGGMVPVR